MNVVRIPITGYGFGCREYGEVLLSETENLNGEEFIAKLEPALCEKQNCTHMEPDISEGCLKGAVDLVLRKRIK